MSITSIVSQQRSDIPPQKEDDEDVELPDDIDLDEDEELPDDKKDDDEK